MDADVWVRRGCAVAIPLLLLTAFWLGTRPSEDDDAAGGTAPGASSSSAASAAASAEITVTQRPAGEGALAEPRKEPQEVPQAASRLPFAEDTMGGHVARREIAGSASDGRPAPSGPCGGVVVRVITASKDEDWAFTSIAPAADQPAVIRRIGERVGNWRVSAIEWDRVWLQSGGGRCAVGMHLGAREAAESVGALPRTKKPALEEVEAPPWYVPDEIAEAIDHSRTNELTIPRQAVDAIFDQGAVLLAGMRLEPLRSGEKVVGLRMEDVKTDSLLERLGVESGDVLLALNDAPLASLDSAVEALERARRGGSLVARLERQGEVFDLRVRVR
jgi:general secretion pathway protein C